MMSNDEHPPQHGQRGVALLTVLLLVVSITVVAGSMLASQKITTRKSSLLFDQDRFIQQLHAGRQLAIDTIRTDAKLNDFDSFDDIWAKPIPPYQSKDGYIIELSINDAAARFNLNNLYHHGATDRHALASFQRLLEGLGLDPQLAIVVLDWQDPDSDVHNDGGEEAIVYQHTDGRTVKVANQPFISIEQLADLPDVSAETIATLRPYVTAVPYWLPINVNTADELVLQSVLKVDMEGMEGEVASQPTQPTSQLADTDTDSALQKLITAKKSHPIESKQALQELQLFGNVDKQATSQQPKPSKPQTTQTEKEDQSDKQSTAQTVAEKKARDKRRNAIAQAEALLDVQSQAFEVLILAKQGKHSNTHSSNSNNANDTSVNDSSTNHQSTSSNSTKSRYATLMIAKFNASADGKPSINTTAGKSRANQADTLIIDSYAQRMWAYPPPFIASVASSKPESLNH